MVSLSTICMKWRRYLDCNFISMLYNVVSEVELALFKFALATEAGIKSFIYTKLHTSNSFFFSSFSPLVLVISKPRWNRIFFDTCMCQSWISDIGNRHWLLATFPIHDLDSEGWVGERDWQFCTLRKRETGRYLVSKFSQSKSVIDAAAVDASWYVCMTKSLMSLPLD